MTFIDYTLATSSIMDSKQVSEKKVIYTPVIIYGDKEYSELHRADILGLFTDKNQARFALIDKMITDNFISLPEALIDENTKNEDYEEESDIQDLAIELHHAYSRADNKDKVTRIRKAFADILKKKVVDSDEKLKDISDHFGDSYYDTDEDKYSWTWRIDEFLLYTDL